jgi:hypothetical protein
MHDAITSSFETLNSETIAQLDEYTSHVATTPWGTMYLIPSADEPVGPPILTPLWARPWSVPHLAVSAAPVDRFVFVPHERPINKLICLRALAGYARDETLAIFADADVLVGERDYTMMQRTSFSILTGGPEVVGTFGASPAAVLEALEHPGTTDFDGWGHEDLFLYQRLHDVTKRLPDLIEAEDTLAISHANVLRHHTSDGRAPFAAEIDNRAVYNKHFPNRDDAMSRMLATHCGRIWRRG